MSTTIPLPPPEAGTEYKAPATFLRWVLVTFVLVAALNIGVSLRFGAIKGDLTRVGGFAERDYQPGAPQAEAIFWRVCGLSPRSTSSARASRASIEAGVDGDPPGGDAAGRWRCRQASQAQTSRAR